MTGSAPAYRIRWQVTEDHEAEVSAERLAELIGIPADKLDQGGLDDAELILEDSLAEIEGDDTYDGATYRRYVEISPITDAAEVRRVLAEDDPTPQDAQRSTT